MTPTVVAHEPGSLVVVRTVTAGLIRWASAAVCVRDDDEGIAYYQPNLTPNKVTIAASTRWPDRRGREAALRKELVDGEFVLVDKVPAKAGPTLAVALSGDWFSVRFVHTTHWRPEYVNVCLPYRRSVVGFDTDDLCLDLLLEERPDGTVAWERKDDEALDERATLGIYSAEQVRAIRSAGAAAIERLSAGGPPFDGSWSEWSPDPGWALPVGLPGNWADDVVDLGFAPSGPASRAADR